MESGEKRPQPARAQRTGQLGLLQSDAPNVTTLVRVGGAWFAVRCVDGQVVARKIRGR